MKKFIGLIMSIAIAVSAFTVFASDVNDVEIYSADGKIYTDTNKGDAQTAILAFYDEGKLVYSTHSRVDNGTYTFSVSDEYKENDIRISYIGEGTFDAVISEAPTQTPVSTISPTPTEKPSGTATPKPTKAPYPAIYPRAVDAIHAPAVIKNVEQVMEDGELFYSADILYQGSEMTVKIRDWVQIVSASDESAELIGLSADALKEGDVVHCSTEASGRIKSIEFIYRPTADDYILDGGDYGNNFSNLISDSGKVANQNGWTVAAFGSDIRSENVFVFGAPVKKLRGVLVFADRNGRTIDVPIADGTIVYTVNVSARGDKCALAGTGLGVINANYLPKNSFDDNGNVISWAENDELIYALARVVDGEATEVIVFER